MKIWAGHRYEQKENSSEDFKFKSQIIVGSWTQEESMSFSSINRQNSDSRPNGLNTSYPLVADGDGSSLVHETHDNEWKLGATSYVNLNGGMQPFRSNIGNSQEVETEMCSFISSTKSNTSNLV